MADTTLHTHDGRGNDAPNPYCGHGSCDKPRGHDGVHRCRCGKPVDELAEGCEWHSAAEVPIDRDLIAEGLRLRDAATPGPYEVLEDNGSFAHLQSLYRIPKDGWRERVGSNMQSRNATWMAWLLNNGPTLLDALGAARTAIDSVQAAHGLQLTRLAKGRAKAERKIVRLTAEQEAAQRPPLGYLAVDTRSEVVLTKGYWGTLAEATSGWGSSSRATIVELREVQP